MSHRLASQFFGVCDGRRAKRDRPLRASFMRERSPDNPQSLKHEPRHKDCADIQHPTPMINRLDRQ